MDTYSLMISGANSTERYYDLNSPFDGSAVAKVERTDDVALEQALRNAEISFAEVMKSMPAYRRAEILYKVADKIKENHELLSLTIAKEGGKPLKDARVEVTRAINTTKMSGDVALELNGEQISMDRSAGTEKHLAFTVREPIGPVLAISAFNHPVNLICHQVCTAFAAGNSVIVKPASQTAISCLKIAQFFADVGLDSRVISVATASGAETETLVADKRIRFITFIGGEDVGWNLLKVANSGVRFALEHGGTGTAIVDSSADLDKVIPSVLKGGFYHAGQVCVSTQMVYVHEDLEQEFTSRLVEQVGALVTGDPLSDATDVGPLISGRDVERVSQWVNEAVDAGAELLCGGKSLDNNCYQPTVLRNVSPEMKVVCKEIFGPVVCVQPYSDIDRVVSTINESNYSFQAAVYAQDIDFAFSKARAIETKACMINDSTAFRVDWMPFGGNKASGLGVGGIKYSILDMTEEKLIVTKVMESN